MIDISTIKFFSLFTGITVAGASFLNVVNPFAQERQEKNVRYVVLQFIKAGDNRSIATLDSVLHQDFRVVANQLNGINTTSLISKSQYLSLMEAGKLGGDQRTVKIESLQIIENNATVRATITGNATVFQTFYSLIKTSNGQWQLIQDLPFVTKK